MNWRYYIKNVRDTQPQVAEILDCMADEIEALTNRVKDLEKAKRRLRFKNAPFYCTDCTAQNPVDCSCE